MRVESGVAPALDPGFQPAVLWRRAYAEAVAAVAESRDLVLALSGDSGCISHFETRVLPDRAEFADQNLRHVERLLKFLLWQQGASRVYLAGAPELAYRLAQIYAVGGIRAFDGALMGMRIHGRPFEVLACPREALPEAQAESKPLGGHWRGCRIGFDLGGSDRKCAALIDGELVHSEEVAWSPYFEKDPAYHRAGIDDSLRRAAAHLPRVDAIGGSVAGIIIDNQPRLSSLFRGLSETDFDRYARPLFSELKRAWGVPFEVVNDGEVTALAGAAMLKAGSVLGIAMGTSQAAGYVNPQGKITTWFNELAFAPVDYGAEAPKDEWSGDYGCGVGYFSQQAVARLAGRAGIAVPSNQPAAETLVMVQDLMQAGEPRAMAIYETIGVYLGYAIAHYADFYPIRHILLLGRVTSGAGGQLLTQQAGKLLAEQFPALGEQIQIHLPGERERRHGQAATAASLPPLP